MDFEIKNIKENIVIVARKLGYVIIDTTHSASSGQGGGLEYNLVRKLSNGSFPRFHLYVTVKGRDYNFSLHLDQKAPIYNGTHAHSGEYFGPVVENEADRIKEILLV